MRLFILFAAALSLAACKTTSTADLEAADARERVCIQKPQLVAEIACMQTEVAKFQLSDPSAQLYFVNATDKIIAAVQAGTVTEDEGRFVYESVKRNTRIMLNSQSAASEQREAELRQQRQAQSSGNMMALGLGLMQLGQPRALPAPSISTTSCRPLGNTVTCSHY